MARLSNLSIAGWKSIQKLDPPLELGPLNVLIGANGSGKSNLVSFFKLLHELEGERLQTYVGQSGGADSLLHLGSKITQQVQAFLEFKVDAGTVQYKLGLAYAASGALLIQSEQFISHADGGMVALGDGGYLESRLRLWAASPHWLVRTISDLLRQFRVYHFHDTAPTARIRQEGYIEANQSLYSDGGNLAAMLYLYQQTKPMIYRRIAATVRHIMPMFDDFVLVPQRLNPKNILLNWRKRGSDYLFGPHQLSDGSLRAMALIALFLQPVEDLPALIVVDEPELGLHPDAITIIAGLIRAASLKTQVILTTQSTTFLDHFEPEEIIVVDDEQGRSTFRHLDSDGLREWLEDYTVSQLWEKNVLGGGPIP